MTEPQKKKHVVVLAHADGWGALSANKVVRHLHEHYPDIAIHLIVSKATRNKEGEILTKVGDLKPSRELKETNLLNYFAKIDEMSKDIPIGVPPPSELFTFEQLGKYCCADHKIHYTTRGGPKGGEEVGEIFKQFEAKDEAPEVILSVDTMAILPKAILEKYPSFSTHPGPLDTVKVEGMQGTLRQLANPVLFDQHGKRLPKDYTLGMPFGLAYVKGTLFLQDPELDKGPPIEVVQTPVVPGMSSYQVRDEVYHVLTDAMIKQLPVLLDKPAREALIAEAKIKKEKLDADHPEHIGELTDGQLDEWQQGTYGIVDTHHPNGIEVIQNEIVNPGYFKNMMRRFFFEGDPNFEAHYTECYGDSLKKIAEQKEEHFTDPWARLYSGEQGVKIVQTLYQQDRIVTYESAMKKNKPCMKITETDLKGKLISSSLEPLGELPNL